MASNPIFYEQYSELLRESIRVFPEPEDGKCGIGILTICCSTRTSISKVLPINSGGSILAAAAPKKFGLF